MALKIQTFSEVALMLDKLSAVPLYLGVEIGGTKQQIAVGTAEGEIIKKSHICLGTDTTASSILSWIDATAQVFLQEYDIKGIGVGFGGPINTATGVTLQSMQVSGWSGFHLLEWFETSFHLPTVVENDTVTGGLAELHMGAGKECSRLFYTNIGTGIGGGLYWDSGYGASSLGYVWVPDWTSDVPGAKTRLEYLCCGPAIEKRLNTPGYIPPLSMLASFPAPLSCKELADAVHKGDAFAFEELDRIAHSFSLGLANMLALAFPERIVIGGGVAKIGEPLFQMLRRFTAENAYVADVGNFSILPGQLQDDAVLAGALLLASGAARSPANKSQ